MMGWTGDVARLENTWYAYELLVRLLQTATLKTNEVIVFAVDLFDPILVQRYSRAWLANSNPQEGHTIFKDSPEFRH